MGAARLGAFVAIAWMACAGCSDAASSADAGPCELEVTWGRGAPGAFEPFVNGDDAELTRGFQGFRYITSTVRVRKGGAYATIWFEVEVAEQEPYVSGAGMRPLERAADGAAYAREVLVFFNDIRAPQLLGRTTRVRAHAAGDRCEARYEASIVVVDDDDCVQGPDGGVSCEAVDAGP